MIFVKTADIKPGMRLARPIYNKKGVLLYERDSRLTYNAILSIKNFGLLGIFVLEPAEPVPPMSQEDIEFERFQTMMGFSVEEELNRFLKTGRPVNTQAIAGKVIREYAHLDKKINFNQNLRSRENYVYKHSLNVAILCAMLSHILNIRIEEQLATVMAAIVHDVGKLTVLHEISDGDTLDEVKRSRITAAETYGYDLIDRGFVDGSAIRRICAQSQAVLLDCEKKTHEVAADKMVHGARILAVAGVYDTMTAMQLDKAPVSEIQAIKYLADRPEYFDPDVVHALMHAVNILVPGVSVELNNGDSALVIAENKQDILRPMILNFRDNTVIDLSDDMIYEDLWIEDVMRTMDNRHVIDVEALKACGCDTEAEEYI